VPGSPSATEARAGRRKGGHLHAERRVSKDASRPVQRVRPTKLPDGVMVALKADDGNHTAWLVLDGTLRQWSFAGYKTVLPIEEGDETELITAPSIVVLLAAGYQPHIHRSARQSITANELSSR
jgi:hypothetical protein